MDITFTLSVENSKYNPKIVFIDDKIKSDNKALSVLPFYNYIQDVNIDLFKAGSGDLLFVTPKNSSAVVICGLGDPSKLTPESIRNAAASAVKFCMSKKFDSVSIISPEVEGFERGDLFRYCAEGALLANYNFVKYKSIDEKDKPLSAIDFVGAFKSLESILAEVFIIAKNTWLCRDLVNDITDEVNPVKFADLAKSIFAKSNVKCRVLTKKDIEKKGMGLLLAVNRGSMVEPRVVVLEYKGDSTSKDFIGLVGKGITFDSGGMNLKPSGSMETMRSDMAGAAAVLCAMKTIAELKIKKNLYGVIPLTENMLSSNAYRPGDIYRAYNGKTVEIGNTDAEGRLILADALSYMEKELKPKCIVDLATLTGACVVTFGETVAAYLSTDESLAKSIEEAASLTGEKLWRLPFFEDYEDRMKSDVADLSNMSSEKNAGTISGAVFLKNFIEKTPWTHVDIAGTAWYSKARGYRPKNATGYGVRLLVELVKGL